MDDDTLLTLAAAILASQGTAETTLGTRFHIPVSAVVAGDAALTAKQRRELRLLFTDYEWMLANKLVVLEETDARGGSLAWQLQQAKAQIATAWLKSGEADSQWVKVPQQDGTVVNHLQISRDYGGHGLRDVLDFAVPTAVAQQIQTKQLDLLEWAKALLPAPASAD